MLTILMQFLWLNIRSQLFNVRYQNDITSFAVGITGSFQHRIKFQIYNFYLDIIFQVFLVYLFFWKIGKHSKQFGSFTRIIVC